MPSGHPKDARHARVTPIRPIPPIDEGRAALAQGAWLDAKRAFETGLAREESAEALEGLALAGWWLNLADVVFDARERAFRIYRERGDAPAAARVAVWIAWDYAAFRGESAVASGWMQRARQLLDEHEPCPEHAWWSVRAGIYALTLDGDPDRALALADDAIRVGRQTGAMGYEMIGRALRGFARAVTGDVADGLRELDGVSAAILAGEITDPVAIGLSCCYLVNACERVRDGDRAVQWCERLEQFCAHWGLRPLLGVCRAHYASVCVWRGAWTEAEQELISANGELASRPGMTGEGFARLGNLRRLQGRPDEAAALYEQAGHHPLATLGRGALALDRGDAARAVDLAERYLRPLPAHNRADRAPGLELLVQAAAAAPGTRDRARHATAELGDIAARARTAPMQAIASLAAARVAAADAQHDAARRHAEDAVDAFARAGDPYDAARARIELAGTLGALGQTRDALAEVERAIHVLKTMRAGHDLAAAEALHARLAAAPEAPPPARATTTALSPREIDVVRLIAKGDNNQTIAEKLFISEHTVHRHVANILTRLDVPSRSAAVAKAAQLGLL